MDTATQTRLARQFEDYAMSMGHTVRLCLTGKAYCSKDFDVIYDKHARRIGHSPAFTVGKDFGKDGMIVVTTPEDASHAVWIIVELEMSVL